MNINRYYLCDSCDHTFMIVQERDEPLKKKCPNCGKHKLYQDLTGQYVAIYQEPSTLGHVADRNTSKMGTYELEAKREQHNKAKKLKPKRKPTWYNTEGKDLSKELKHLDTPEKKTKYIMEGN